MVWRMAVLAVLAAFCWNAVALALAQEEDNGAKAEASESTDGTAEKSGKDIEVTFDPDLEKEFLVLEAVVQIAVQAAEAEGETLDLERLEKDLLTVAETDRQKAYVYLRIAEMRYERGDKEAAIDSLKKGLPLADGDRSKGSLYYRILVSLLTIYDETGRINEAVPYLKIYREIVTAGVDPWERLEGSDDVVHKPSGVRLPMKLDLFTRQKLIVFDETGRDAGAAYRSGTSKYPELTVYLVADFEQPAEDHFNGSMRHILNRFQGVQVLSRGSYSVETANGVVRGFAGRVNVPGERFALGLGSDLYVFVRKGTLVKFRVTFHASEREEMEAVMKRIFGAFDWP